MPLTAERLLKLMQGQAKGLLYDDSVKLYKSLNTHEKGHMPTELIKLRRPSESDAILEYREKIFKSKSKNPIKKVINSLSKIRRSPDWNIRYNEDMFPKSIAKTEIPTSYFEEEFPYHRSLTGWGFSVCLKQYLLDANAIVLVMPLVFKVLENEYLKPFPFIFNSDRVIEFVDGDYVVIESYNKSKFFADKPNQDGKVFWVADKSSIKKYEINTDRKFVLTEEFIHNLGYLPAFKVKGEFREVRDTAVLYESRIYAMADHLDEIDREYSDKQAEMVQHIHSQKWFIQNQKCTTCGGRGKVMVDDKPETCTSCKGSGSAETSPYAHIKVNPAQLGEREIPTPPAGYIEKSTDIVKYQTENIDGHIYDALAAVNFEFLADTPLNQSGKAKEVDRDELNTFCYSVAEDMVEILRRIYRISIDIRYKTILNEDTKLLKQINPVISVPQVFDLLNSKHLIEQYSTAKTAQLSSIILAQLQMEIAAKKFRNEPDVATFTKCYFELDPLPGLTEDEKISRVSNNGVSKLDYVISCNLVSFIRLAMNEEKNFNSLKTDEKFEFIKKLGQEKLKELTSSERLKVDLGDGQ